MPSTTGLFYAGLLTPGMDASGALARAVHKYFVRDISVLQRLPSDTAPPQLQLGSAFVGLGCSGCVIALLGQLR